MAQVRLQGVRPALYAGTWYPGTPGALERAVDHYLSQAQVEPLPGELVGVVAPHAGYIYSGPVAGYAYRAVQESGQSFETVVLVGPSHRYYLDGYGITAVAAYETPLGPVPLDADLLAALARELEPLLLLPRDEEHSLEIQLPFLQRVLGDFRLLPIMMGDQSWEACRALAQALGRVLKGRSALLVASTDLSHYHGYGRAVALDRLVVGRVEAFDP
ncbi:MAG: AmmeMemoRadiSam system protein B, partial [Anaerolineae bacterium]|nr:AmmeMemoRadiSam system protein B [Anaerolineae bacterium]